ncbi:diacylglycerol cholinephosphotransferase Mf1 [Mycoplasmopsis lipofaciens]|uniref:diacylglycerol cholinephosphotransferase Mf1 n=1 Tax=Mycoplasmopsis lipofaciens TaxID=114884 RepID=UPI000486ABE5|nr:LicD family protein [Mycoplasmopsis lipofaciens]
MRHKPIDKEKHKQMMDEVKELLIEVMTNIEKMNGKGAVAYGSLLGLVREKQLIEYDSDGDIIVDYETYLMLKEKYPNRIIDTENSKNPYIIPKWVKENYDLKNRYEPSIDIFVLAKTTLHRYKNWVHDPKIGLRIYKTMTNRDYYFRKKTYYKIAKIFFKLIFWLKDYSVTEAIEYLEKNIKHATLGIVLHKHKFNKKVLRDDTILDPNDLNDLGYIELDGHKLLTFKNPIKYLEHWYGLNWKKPIKCKRSNYYGLFELY